MAKVLPFKILASLVLLLLLITGCQKDPLTLPAKVQFQFGIIPVAPHSEPAEKIEARNSSPNQFTIDQGTLSINAISFEGRRRHADDVFFTAPMDPVVLVDLAQSTASQPVEFDIPQGIYGRVEFIFEIGSEQHLPLVLNGKAHLGGMLGEIPLRFEYEFAEPVRVIAKGKGSDDIVLQKDNSATARLEVDADFLFRLINPGMINNASIEELEGHPVIIINSSKNPQLFNILAARLDQSFKVTFE